MDFSFELNVEQSARVSPTLIAVNHVLALSSQELQALIKQEAEENPALDLIEHQTCARCGEVLAHGACRGCLRRTSDTSHEDDAGDSFDFSSLGYRDDELRGAFSSLPENDEFDPVSLVAAEASMDERFMLDVRSVIASEDFPIAEYLLGSLDDRGFLMSETAAIAEQMGVAIERVDAVLGVMQKLGPPGIAARDPRECLLLQLDYIEQESGESAPNVRPILTNYFVELGEHKYSYIAQKLGIHIFDVESARDYIRHNLTPFPVMSVDDDYATWGRPSKAQYVAPDVIIREVDGELDVEVVESRRFFMSVNPLYGQMAADLKTRSVAATEDERKHISQYVARTRLFINNIRQRRETLTKIANALVEHQQDYLRQGVRHLHPLTRAQIAEVTSLHESTVSRATASKYVMLPNRQVVPFSDFFTASLSVKDVIKEIVESEGKPMADREIVARLRENGIRIARRTVAKYRSQLGILPSTLR